MKPNTNRIYKLKAAGIVIPLRIAVSLRIAISFIIIAALIIISGNSTTALAASASLNGPGTVRAGDTITVTLNVSASGSYGLEGTLSYNSSVVTLTGTSISANGWKLETNGNKLVAYDDTLSHPLSGSQNVLTATFRVNGTVAAGTKLTISADGLIATDGTNESSMGSAVYSTSIASPLSGNANLSSLSVNGASLTPAFSSNTTAYSLGEVDFSVASLTVNAVAEDSKATVSVSGAALNVGANTVTVTVKAENGASKAYTISVTRKQDPNYVASSNASLSSITLSTGVLSPSFSPDITSYVVYLPYETKAISASGTAADAKAAPVAGSELSDMADGEHILTLTGTAEDGTKKEYTIAVIVMPEYKGTLPKIEGVEHIEPETEGETETKAETETQKASLITISDSDDTSGGGFNIAVTIVLVILAAGAGFGVCFLLYRKGIIKL